jgi:hypothetical protein
MYYGFSRFAIELNEIQQDQAHLYPSTDTRFRPDQRYAHPTRLSNLKAALVTSHFTAVLLAGVILQKQHSSRWPVDRWLQYMPGVEIRGCPVV